jgi:transcriptional antiterminator RfaH
MNWYALSTKRAEELKAALHLTEQGITCFLPHRLRTVRHARKLLVKKTALFPGYIFVQLDLADDALTALRSTRGVKDILCADAHRPSKLNEELMNNLIARCDEAGQLLPPGDLTAGNRVQFTKGPFQDLLATVEKIAGKDRVWLLLDDGRISSHVIADREMLSKK